MNVARETESKLKVLSFQSEAEKGLLCLVREFLLKGSKFFPLKVAILKGDKYSPVVSYGDLSIPLNA